MFGYVILRRRGVYFSLLTMALSAMLYRGLPLDRRDRRRKRSRRHHPTRFARISPREQRWPTMCWSPRSPFRRLPAVALSSLAGGTRPGGDPREREARPLHWLSDQQYKLLAFVFRRRDRTGRHAAAVQQPYDLGRSDLGGLLRRTAGDGDHRRHALVPRTCARSPLLCNLPRLPLRASPRIGCSTSACCSSPSSCFRRRVSSAWANGCARRLRKTVVEAAAWPAARPASAASRLPEAGNHTAGPVLVVEGWPRHFGGIKAVEGAASASRTAPYTPSLAPTGPARPQPSIWSRACSRRMREGRAGGERSPACARTTSAGPASAARSRSPTVSRSDDEENIRLAVQSRHPQALRFLDAARAPQRRSSAKRPP